MLWLFRPSFGGGPIGGDPMWMRHIYDAYLKHRRKTEEENEPTPEEALDEIIEEVQAIIEEPKPEPPKLFTDYAAAAKELADLKAALLIAEAAELAKVQILLAAAEQRRAEIALKILLDKIEEDEAVMFFTLFS
jgi:hypothetical protein